MRKQRMTDCFRIALWLLTAPLLMNGCEKDPGVGIYVAAEGEWQTHDPLIHGAVVDVDGNVYDAVKLGEQTWMAQNLSTIRYADGMVVSTEPGAAFYMPKDQEKSGVLYNWVASVRNGEGSGANPSGVQGICPDGWHLPSEAEWRQLMDYVGSQECYACAGDLGHIAKSLADTSGWKKCAESCTPGDSPFCNNATGFSAVPVGCVKQSGYFVTNDSTRGNGAYFWSATQESTDMANGFFIGYSDAGVSIGRYSEEQLFSVRCVRD